MKVYENLGALLSAFGYIPLLIILFNRPGSAHFATWMLLAVLDVMLAVNSYLTGDNWVVPALFGAGNILATTLLIYKGAHGWGKFENQITIMILMCSAVWYFAGDVPAALAMIAANTIACVPQFTHYWKKPDLLMIVPTFFFMIGCTTSLIWHDFAPMDTFIKSTLFSLVGALVGVVSIYIISRRHKVIYGF